MKQVERSTLEEPIMSGQDGIEYDPDSSPAAWEYFQAMYTAEHWELLKGFDMINLKQVKGKKSTRLISRIDKASEYYGEGKLWTKFAIGGETDFNFSPKKKYLKFKKYVEGNKEALATLERCKERHHSLANFSLMARTGGLQLVKGSNVFDRFDRFIFRLNEFFVNENEKLILSRARGNRKPLKNFLRTFGDADKDARIYDYCAKVYFIDDKEMVKRMIESGEKPIECQADVIDYMDLAEKYWALKESRWRSRVLV